MTPSDKLREIVEKWGYTVEFGEWHEDDERDELLSDLTALISEGYVEKSKYDELLRQRDELREALLYLMDGVRGLPPLTAIVGVLEQQYIQAEAAIKNTER